MEEDTVVVMDEAAFAPKLEHPHLDKKGRPRAQLVAQTMAVKEETLIVADRGHENALKAHAKHAQMISGRGNRSQRRRTRKGM